MTEWMTVAVVIRYERYGNKYTQYREVYVRENRPWEDLAEDIAKEIPDMVEEVRKEVAKDFIPS
jgi:hypothetical protein